MKKGKKEARQAMLRQLKSEMSKDKYKDGGVEDMLKGMKKVTIAAPTEEGLKEGLKKAPKMLSKAEKIMKARDEFSCGGSKKKYEDGGVKEKRYKEDDEISKSMKSLMEKTESLTSEELKEKIKKLKEKSK